MQVLSAILVLVLGAGLFAGGLLWPGMYDVGILVMVIGAVGVAVRAVEWARWLLRPEPQPSGPAAAGAAEPRSRECEHGHH
jgi:hypothetical protein